MDYFLLQSTPLILFTFFFILIIKYYWDTRKLKSTGLLYLGNGTLQIIGNVMRGISLPQHVYNIHQRVKLGPGHLGLGTEFGKTTLTVSNPTLLRSIFVKDFANFEDRREFSIPKEDILLGKMLSSLKGDKWKLWRTKLSPTFTTSKIKRLFPIFDDSGAKLVSYLGRQLDKSISSSCRSVDMTLAFRKFSLDVIVACACGLDSKAFSPESDEKPSIFEEMGDKMHVHFDGLQVFKFLIILIAPKLADWMGLSVLSIEGQHFWADIMQQSIQERRSSGLTEKDSSFRRKVDFVQLLLENKSSTGNETGHGDSVPEIDETEELVANCVQLLLGGLDTVQAALVFSAYVLATNQDVQSRLRSEVNGLVNENMGQINYDSIGKMAYLDMFVNETMRLYPPAVDTDRRCTADYHISGNITNTIDYVMKKGEMIAVPIYGLHLDPEYFSNPERFDPERFSPENKHNINPYAFLPFGAGPRICVASRFALLEIKVAVAHLVRNFQVFPTKETLIPMKFGNGNALKPIVPMKLGLKRMSN